MKFVALLIVIAANAKAQTGDCERLKSLSLPDTTITAAESVPAGPFVVPGSTQNNPPPLQAAARCRVTAMIKPSSDSEIEIEVWMPSSGWNGKFLGVGNGGWSGAISYGALVTGLREGYATASTDTGHKGPRAMFVLGHPEKVIDFGHRAVHEMTVKAKAIINSYYGTAPRRSYWNGCSSGGKQGLKEAQMYPADYDGIIAGAPANHWTHLTASLLHAGVTNLKDPAATIPRSKFPLIHNAVLQACDKLDGVTDGFLTDPRSCRFDPSVLKCKGEDTAECLTAKQVETAKTMYGPTKDPQTGKIIYPGLAPGSELWWAPALGGPEPFLISARPFPVLRP